MAYLAHALLHTHTHTHSVTHPRPGSVGREKNLGERKKMSMYANQASKEEEEGCMNDEVGWGKKKRALETRGPVSI